MRYLLAISILLVICSGASAQNVFCPQNANCTYTGNSTHSGTNTFTGTTSLNSLKNINTIAIVDPATCLTSWGVSEYGACVMAAIASFPTVNSNKAGKVLLAPSIAIVTQSSGVTITSPFVSVEGPGPGALQISCTFNGNCWDVHTNTFTISPGLILRGFSVVGTGTANANAVGFSIGDVIGGHFEDLTVDNFRGANSACFWFNNINGFTERNEFNALHAGLAQGGQNGCTKDYRWSQPATAATSSFAHNHYIANKYSVGTGQIALSIEGGNHSDTDWFFTGNSFQGTTSTVLALSGLTSTVGGSPAFIEATNLNISAECTSPCTTGTLLSLAATNNIFIHSGGGFFDLSTLLTSSISGNLIRYANSNMNASSAPETLRFSTFPGAGVAKQYDVSIQHPAASRAVTWIDCGGACAFVWDIATQTLTNKTLTAPVINGTPTGTGIATLTLKKGSGGGNYATASTTYVVVDSTNLCNTVTIPTGWKLSIVVNGALGTATGAVIANLALTDNAACGTANAGILVETTETTTAAGVLQPIGLSWVINGDGAAHNVALQYKTSAGADSATILNSSATSLPTMVFTLMPSN